MNPIDEFAIDRAPDVRPVWATSLEWCFTIINILMLLSSLVGSFAWLMWMVLSLPAAAYGKLVVTLMYCIPLILLNGWYTWVTTIGFIRFYPRWRYASQVYADTWVKERIREFRREHGTEGASNWLFLSVVPWGYFLYLQFHYQLPAWTWLFWGLFVLWGPLQGRYLARIYRLSVLVLTTEAPSSRSRFAPSKTEF